MLRRLPLLLTLAWAIPSCESPSEEAWPPAWPAPMSGYTFQDPRTTAWRVFEGGGDFRPFVQPVPGGLIEWTGGSVVGEGRGLAKGNTPQEALMARRAARLLAARNALLAVGGLSVGPGGTFRNVSNGTIRLDAVLRDFQEIRSDFDPATRTATAAVRIPLYGARGAIRIAGLSLRPLADTWAAGNWTGTGAPQNGPKATLIVLDLRGTGFRPALLPRFVSPEGECIFDGAKLGEEEISWRPAATYVTYAPGPRTDEGNPPRAGTLIPWETDDSVFGESVARTFPGTIFLARCKPGTQAGTVVLPTRALQYMGKHPQMEQLFPAGKVVIVMGGPAAGNVSAAVP